MPGVSHFRARLRPLMRRLRQKIRSNRWKLRRVYSLKKTSPSVTVTSKLTWMTILGMLRSKATTCPGWVEWKVTVLSIWKTSSPNDSKSPGCSPWSRSVTWPMRVSTSPLWTTESNCKRRDMPRSSKTARVWSRWTDDSKKLQYWSRKTSNSGTWKSIYRPTWLRKATCRLSSVYSRNKESILKLWWRTRMRSVQTGVICIKTKSWFAQSSKS